LLAASLLNIVDKFHCNILHCLVLFFCTSEVIGWEDHIQSHL